MSIRSELENSRHYLRDTRNAIVGRGGEIAPTAGLKDLAQAVYSIPADASLSYQTDSSTAYSKTVPSGASKYAMLSQLGGMTQKVLKETDNLMPYPYAFTPDAYLNEVNGVIRYNRTWAEEDLHDGFAATCDFDLISSSNPITLESGTYIVDGLVSAFDNVTLMVAGMVAEDLGNGKYKFTLSQTTTISSMRLTQDTTTDPAKTYTFEMRPVLYNEASGAVEFEPRGYELRDTKVTSIVSHGANLLDASKLVNAQMTDNGDGTYTLTRREAKNDRFSAYAPVYIPANTRFFVDVDFLSYNGISEFEEVTYAPILQVIYEDGSAYSITNFFALKKWGGQWYSYEKAIVKARLFISDGAPVGTYVTFRNLIISYSGIASENYKPYRETLYNPIPEELLPAHGINENVYDYTEFENIGINKQHKRVGVVDMGTLKWTYGKWGSDMVFTATLNGVKSSTTSVLSTIPFATENDIYYARADNAYCINARNIRARFSSYTDVASFKAAMSGVMLYYELAEPEVTDISELSTTFDPYILVDELGRVEFANERKNAVPSTITYLVETAGA